MGPTRQVSSVVEQRTTVPQALKRVFDVSLAVLVLTVCSPLIALIALAIKLDDCGPVLFIQDRVGRSGRRFRCAKFRTMVRDADRMPGGFTVVSTDPRMTRVGRILRLWTLDELPQLVNVLRGEMSIVGPR